MDNDNTKQQLPLKRKAIYWCIVILALIAINALIYTCVYYNYNRNEVVLTENHLSDIEKSALHKQTRKKQVGNVNYKNYKVRYAASKRSAKDIERLITKQRILNNIEQERISSSVFREDGIEDGIEDSDSNSSRLNMNKKNYLQKIRELSKTWDLIQSTSLISNKASSFTEINKKVESFLANRRHIHAIMTEIESIKMDYFAIKSISFDKYETSIINDFFNIEKIHFGRANNEFFERLSRIDGKKKYDYKDINYVLEPLEKLRTDKRIKSFMEDYITQCFSFLEKY